MCKSFYLAPHKGLRYKLGMPRKPLSTKIDNDLQKEIKKLAIDMERSFNDLLEDAIRDFLKKHGKQVKK